MPTVKINGRRCLECRDGEHDNYDEDVQYTIVRNPDDKLRPLSRDPLRRMMCEHHREMYMEDGYHVTIITVSPIKSTG